MNRLKLIVRGIELIANVVLLTTTIATVKEKYFKNAEVKEECAIPTES